MLDSHRTIRLANCILTDFYHYLNDQMSYYSILLQVPSVKPNKQKSESMAASTTTNDSYVHVEPAHVEGPESGTENVSGDVAELYQRLEAALRKQVQVCILSPETLFSGLHSVVVQVFGLISSYCISNRKVCTLNNSHT